MKKTVHTRIYGKTGAAILRDLRDRWVKSGGPGVFYAAGIASKLSVADDNEVLYEVDDDRGTIFEEGDDKARVYLARYLQNNVLISLDLGLSWYGVLPTDLKQKVSLTEGGAEYRAGDLVALKAYLEGDERQQSLFGDKDRMRVEGVQADPIETELNAAAREEREEKRKKRRRGV